MKKHISLICLMTLLTSNLAWSVGKIQNEDVKDEATLVGSGSDKSHLIHDDKVYITALGINDRLDNAIVAGTIGGGSGSGVQLISNPGFEVSATGNPPTSWTITTGTGSIDTSTFYAGKQAEVITASSQASSIQQDVTPTQAYSAVNMEASCQVKTSLTNVQVCARTGAVNLSSCTAVPSTNTWQYVAMNFIGPSSGSVGVQVGMTGSGSGSFTVDSCYVGPARNLSQVSQAYLLGTVSISGSAASWSTSSTSFVDFSAASGTTYSTTGSASAPASNIPAIKFASIPPGELYLSAEGTFEANTTGKAAYFQFWDGTNTARETSYMDASGGTTFTPGIHQSIAYTTSQSNVTLSIRGKADSGGGAAVFGTAANPLVIKVYFFPSQSQGAYNPSLSQYPQITVLTSGSGTYTTPAGTSYLEVQMVGGGGGGGAAITNAGANGNDSTFGTSLLTASHGLAGAAGGNGTQAGGAGGGTTVNSPAVTRNVQTGQDGQANAQATTSVGGAGGSSCFGGGGVGGTAAGSAGGDAKTNSGSGGAGAKSSTGATVPATGGGAGGCIDAIIKAPSATFSYTVGAGGAGGAAGTFKGGNGGDGIIVVTAYPALISPVLVGSVVSSSSGQDHIERIRIPSCTSGTCTISNQSGGFSSVTFNATGDYIFNFVAGTFSSAPTCVCSLDSSTSFGWCSSRQGTTSSVELNAFTGANAAQNSGMLVICMGPH